MNKLTLRIKACGIFLLFAAAAISTPAQSPPVIAPPTTTFTLLHSFHGRDGRFPEAALVQGANGKFYGITNQGGAYQDGTVFSITAGGTLTTLHSFDYTDGTFPEAGLVQGTNGKFYGTTSGGGPNSCPGNGCGTVFSITAGGTLTTLHLFDGTDGAYPGALIQGTNGKFYGTTYYGGATGSCNNGYLGCGTVFSITASGTLTTLHTFCANGFPCADGAYPQSPLIQGTDGRFYGTTGDGGSGEGDGYGTVFSITAGGTLETLHSFDGADGADPEAPLIQGTNGRFYGTTGEGGADNDGTIFSITASGTLTTLHSFDVADGVYPYARLVQGTNGKFYGTAYEGGANNDGTVFSITASGTLTTLHIFHGADGAYPEALIRGTNGKFYGTTVGAEPITTAVQTTTIAVAQSSASHRRAR